jgi:carboxypeptidase Q
MQTYSSNTKIPTACIAVEDANTLERLYRNGQKITLNLKMEAQSLPSVVQENVVAEIKGSTWPDQTVLISGHLDSWDVGVGAMDDGGGAFISWQALSAYLHLNIAPKRTIRMVMWACEEFGGIGGQSYFNAHKDEVSSMSLVMESDLGTFTPLGIQFTGSAAAMSIMTTVGQLLTPINASIVTTGGEGTDIDPWMSAGVPGASLLNDNDKYFWFHHSEGDRMDVEDSTALDLCAATWAVTALGVANLDSLLPRGSQ